MAGEAYAGLKRRKRTPWGVRFGDAFASRLIAVGGIGTIVAILLVVLVLLRTALPLARAPSYEQWRTFSVPQYEHVGVDESASLLWGMSKQGDIVVHSLHDASELARYSLETSTNASISCSALSIDRATLAIGLSDGTVRTTQISFQTRLFSPTALPTGVSVSQRNPTSTVADAIYQWLDPTTVRESRLRPIQWSAARKLGDAPVLAVDYLPDESASRLAQSSSAHLIAIVGKSLVSARIASKQNRLTKKTVDTVETSACPLEVRSADGVPLSIMLVNGDDHIVVVWANGTLDRYSLAAAKPRLVESQPAVIGVGRITAAAPLLARQNVLCGLQDGRLQGWMIIRPENDSGSTADGLRLTLAHEIQVSASPLVSVRSSPQSHVAVTANAFGETALVYVTTDRLLGTQKSPASDGIQSLGFDSAGDTLVMVSHKLVSLMQFDIGYPEASLRGLLGNVWYEGYDRPKAIWQSSSGTEKSEMKISLLPLIFGTIKATLYAMVISVPLAVLAAIYTSEFLSPSTRSKVKPVIELMASLPSVVLGFIAAMVVAPFLQEHLVAVLVSLVVVPSAFVASGNLWNLLPVDWIVRLQPYRLLAMFVCLPVAICISALMANPAEQWLFEGSLIGWLGSDRGSATGGWMLLLIPVVMFLSCIFVAGTLAERTRRFASRSSPWQFAAAGVIHFIVMTAVVVGLSWFVGAALASFGFDLRDHFFDNYQDRNALLVGGALGFCVIPIIYTISDDALQAVPRQLRSASLGCGATPWQTTMRVVVPSAMSGLFSAVMIGLGRAVGETMVVLMAAGNTPVMEWNPFNGFRTLSATLATELPEAAKGSTHYRTLFLAALLLFFLTLIANTFAEFVRLRFRKRASQL